MVLLQAERLRSRLAGGPDWRGADAIVRSAQHMASQPRDLVGSARLEVGLLRLSVAPRSLGALLPRLEAERAADWGGRVRLAVSPGLPPVSADAERLARAVASLAWALRASPGEVRLEAALAHGDVVVSARSPSANAPPRFDRRRAGGDLPPPTRPCTPPGSSSRPTAAASGSSAAPTAKAPCS